MVESTPFTFEGTGSWNHVFQYASFSDRILVIKLSFLFMLVTYLANNYPS